MFNKLIAFHFTKSKHLCYNFQAEQKKKKIGHTFLNRANLGAKKVGKPLSKPASSLPMKQRALHKATRPSVNTKTSAIL
jgi:hypothetical protein